MCIGPTGTSASDGNGWRTSDIQSASCQQIVGVGGGRRIPLHTDDEVFSWIWKISTYCEQEVISAPGGRKFDEQVGLLSQVR